MWRRDGGMQHESVVVTVLAVLVAVSAASAASGAMAPEAQAAERKPASQLLGSLPVAPEAASGYSRDLFRHWVDADGDGCDTREEVLLVEAVSGTRSGCRVAGGSWASEYDGVTTSDSGTFDVDHMVPLKEAWDSGAWRWTARTRQAYANDLGYANSLIAVTAGSNRSKGDRDPAEWLPTQARCAYVKQWIAVKFRWRLSVDTREKSALAVVLRGCPPLMAVPPLATRTLAAAAEPAGAQDSGAQGSGPQDSSPQDSGSGLDPRFRTCGSANAAGYGPYRRGADPEYAWYVDRDGDGLVCEP